MARRRQDSSCTGVAILVAVVLVGGYYVLRFLYNNSLALFLICLALFCLLGLIHAVRGRNSRNAQLEHTLGQTGATVFVIVFVCMIAFGGTALGKAVFGGGDPEQAARQEPAVQEPANEEPARRQDTAAAERPSAERAEPRARKPE